MASRIGNWSALTNFSLPSGSVTIENGPNRQFVFCINNENAGQQTITTFTIGGVSFDHFDQHFLEAGSTDNNLWIYVWDEASIQAMTGTAIVFAGISSGAQMSWGYCTLQDCNQASPFFQDAGATGSNSHALSTPSETDDWLVGLSMDRSQNRAPLACDTMTQRLEQSASFYAMGIFDDAGGPDISTFTNDGLNGDFSAMSAVFANFASVKTANARLADVDGVDRANLTNLNWAWYDVLPATGVFPTDFAADGATDATGNFSVEIPKTTLNAGQVGYLLIYDPANSWSGIYAITVA